MILYCLLNFEDENINYLNGSNANKGIDDVVKHFGIFFCNDVVDVNATRS